MNTGDLYETTIRIFLGDKAKHIADDNLTQRRASTRKVVQQIQKQIINIETTERHREQLNYNLHSLNEALKQKSVDPWYLFYSCLKVLARMLGYDYLVGVRPNTPVYFQTPDQHFTSDLLSPSPNQQYSSVKKCALARRRELIMQLSNEGVSDFDQSLIFGVTEYKIKKIRKNS